MIHGPLCVNIFEHRHPFRFSNRHSKSKQSGSRGGSTTSRGSLTAFPCIFLSMYCPRLFDENGLTLLTQLFLGGRRRGILIQALDKGCLQHGRRRRSRRGCSSSGCGGGRRRQRGRGHRAVRDDEGRFFLRGDRFGVGSESVGAVSAVNFVRFDFLAR